jgi:hypothetical protein
MKAISLIIITFLLIVTEAVAQTTASSGCRVFVLKRANNDVFIEAVALDEGAVKVFPVNKTGNTITPILPYGLGQSGDLVKLSESRFFIAQCVQGELRVKVRSAEGAERNLLTVKVEDAAKYDLRANVIGKSAKKAFIIRQGEKIEVDEAGPVIDLFGGQLSVGEDEYIVTTEVSPRWTGPDVRGEADVEYVRTATGAGGYLFTKARLAGGKEGDFVIDLAASKTLVAKSFLPSDINIREATAKEYSNRGERTVAYTLGGAGGAIESPLGIAKILELRAGSIVFSDASVVVISALPKIGDRQVAGIIGIDLLKRANRFVLTFPQKAGETSTLTFDAKSDFPQAGAIELPFSVASDHLFVKGYIKNAPVDFIIDTGSPISILSMVTTKSLGLETKGQPGATVRGLDGKSIEVQSTIVQQMRLGMVSYSTLPFEVSDLPLFKSIGLQGNVGVLGNAFLQLHKKVEVDFAHRKIRLVR